MSCSCCQKTKCKKRKKPKCPKPCLCCIDRPTGQPNVTRAEIEAVLARCRTCNGVLSAADLATLVRAYFTPFNTSDTSIYELFISPDFVTRPEIPDLPPGPEGLAIIVEEAHIFLPDFNITIDQLVVCGDTAASRSTITGTAPDGVSFVFAAADFFTFRNCQITDNFALVNELSATEPELLAAALTTSSTRSRRGRF